jgi:predicted amidohydrolase YtcJ
MLEPYEQNPDNTGILTITDEELKDTVRRASEAGLNVAMHAIGDRANRMALDAIEASLKPIRKQQLRPRIEHAQLLAPEDIKRLGQLGVIASMQPIHATSDWMMADRHWGARCQGAYAWRSILNAGAHLCFGSDSPVEPLDPLRGIYAAVVRKDEQGRPVGGWIPEQCLSVQEAVYAYTMGAAFASGEERVSGSITPGKRADVVVLSENLFAGPPEIILQASVEMTIVGGQIVFRS